MIPGLLRFARNDGGSETLAISPKRSAERIRTLLAQNGAGLKIVAGRILARKSIEPDAEVWRS